MDFEELYNIYYKRLFAFIYKMAFKEITQKSFYQAFISFHRYDRSCEIFKSHSVSKESEFDKNMTRKIKCVQVQVR